MAPTLTRPEYHFVPEPLSPEQRTFCRSWGIDYSAPGEHGGIRQYETFSGTVHWVHVHPSFPAVLTHGQYEGLSCGWHTSDREQALNFAATARNPPSDESYASYPRMIDRMLAAAEQAIRFLGRHARGGRVDASSDSYATDAAALYQAVNWQREEGEDFTHTCAGSLAWSGASKAALTLHLLSHRQRDVDRAAETLAAEIGSHLLLRAREGWLPMPVAVEAIDRLEAATKVSRAA